MLIDGIFGGRLHKVVYVCIVAPRVHCRLRYGFREKLSWPKHRMTGGITSIVFHSCTAQHVFCPCLVGASKQPMNENDTTLCQYVDEITTRPETHAKTYCACIIWLSEGRYSSVRPFRWTRISGLSGIAAVVRVLDTNGRPLFGKASEMWN